MTRTPWCASASYYVAAVAGRTQLRGTQFRWTVLRHGCGLRVVDIGRAGSPRLLEPDRARAWRQRKTKSQTWLPQLPSLCRQRKPRRHPVDSSVAWAWPALPRRRRCRVDQHAALGEVAAVHALPGQRIHVAWRRHGRAQIDLHNGLCCHPVASAMVLAGRPGRARVARRGPCGGRRCARRRAGPRRAGGRSHHGFQVRSGSVQARHTCGIRVCERNARLSPTKPGPFHTWSRLARDRSPKDSRMVQQGRTVPSARR